MAFSQELRMTHSGNLPENSSKLSLARNEEKIWDGKNFLNIFIRKLHDLCGGDYVKVRFKRINSRFSYSGFAMVSESLSDLYLNPADKCDKLNRYLLGYFTRFY